MAPICFTNRFNYGARNMLRMAMMFLVLALVAGVLGFGGLASASMGIAKILFWLFVVLFVVTLVVAVAAGRKITS